MNSVHQASRGQRRWDKWDEALLEAVAQIDCNDPNCVDKWCQVSRSIEDAREQEALRRQRLRHIQQQIIDLESIVDAVEPNDDDKTLLRCSRCGETKPANRYYRASAWRHGRAGMCRACSERKAQERIRELEEKRRELEAGNL